MRVLSVTAVRNEAPYLVEWIAHYRNIGVTDFLVYSNDCEDGTTEMLTALDEAGVIVHIPQSLSLEDSPQWSALRAAWKHPLRKVCDWAIVSDVDEFVAIHVGKGRFADLFHRLPENTDAVIMPWRLFGNNGKPFADDGLVTQRFVASMDEVCSYPIATTLFKSLFRLDGPFNQFGVHRPKQKHKDKAGQPVWVGGDGRAMPEAFAENQKRLSLYGFESGRSLVECNHYSLRSAEEFLLKRARGLPNQREKAIDLTYWVERNFNTVENTSIARSEEGRIAEMQALMSLPNIGQLHLEGQAWHRKKFLELIKSRKAHRLFSRAVLASSSQSPAPDVIQTLVRLYQETDA